MVKNRKWLLMIMPVLVFSLLLAACADTTEATEEPGLNDEAGTVQGTQQTEPLSPADNMTATPMTDTTPMATEVTQEATAAATAEATTAATPAAGAAGGMAQFGDATTQWVSSDRVVGMPVYNADGEQISQVSDALVNDQGQIAYVIFDATDFLQADQQQSVAVAWDSFDVRALDQTSMNNGNDTGSMAGGSEEAGEASDADKTGTPEAGEDQSGVAGNQALMGANEDLVLVYTGSTDQLQNEKTIDQSMLNQGITVNFDELTAGQMDANAGMAGSQETATPEATAAMQQTATPEAGNAAGAMTDNGRMLVLSQIDNYNLVNNNGDDVGEIGQVLIDLHQGAIAYAIADIGGFLGIGENQIAVPWSQLQLDETQEAFVLPVDQQTLQDAPTFDNNMLDNGVFQPGWNDQIDSYWDGIS